MLFAGSFCEFREFPGLYDLPGITINYRDFLRSFRVFPPSPPITLLLNVGNAPTLFYIFRKNFLSLSCPSPQLDI